MESPTQGTPAMVSASWHSSSGQGLLPARDAPLSAPRDWQDRAVSPHLREGTRPASGVATPGVWDEDSMKRSVRRIIVFGLLGFLLAIGVSTAQAGRVNFEKETHF